MFLCVQFIVALFCLSLKRQPGDPRCYINTGEKKQLPSESVHFRWWRNVLNGAHMLNILMLQERKE